MAQHHVDDLYAAGWFAIIPDTATVSTHRIGTPKVGAVLMFLAHSANRHGLAWPGRDTIAKATGLYSTDVRQALDVLAAAGLITPAGRVQRANRYQLNIPAADDSSTPPVPIAAPEVAGIPADTGDDEVAGEVAGKVAGNLAGIPAANRTEQKKNPPTPLPGDGQLGIWPAPVPGGEETERRDNASSTIAALRQLILPVPPTVALALCADAGDGDPWAGYLRIKPALIEPMDGADHPEKLLRWRIGNLISGTPTPEPTRPERIGSWPRHQNHQTAINRLKRRRNLDAEELMLALIELYDHGDGDPMAGWDRAEEERFRAHLGDLAQHQETASA